MSCPIKSAEWGLIHRLSLLWARRRRPYEPQHPTNPFPGRGERPYEKLFDSELAILFNVGLEFSGAESSTEVFQQSEHIDVFRGVCRFLNSSVRAEFSLVDPDGGPVEDSEYPALEGLARYLDGLDPKNSEVFDLATGPSRKLFKLPDDASLRTTLHKLMGWNISILKIFPLPRDEAPAAKLKSRGKPWENTQLRDQATDAFQVLFKGQRCKSRHEVKLRLGAGGPQVSQGAEDSLLDPTLHMWYFCSDSNRWQEVLYGLSQ